MKHTNEKNDTNINIDDISGHDRKEFDNCFESCYTEHDGILHCLVPPSSSTNRLSARRVMDSGFESEKQNKRKQGRGNHVLQFCG